MNRQLWISSKAQPQPSPVRLIVKTGVQFTRDMIRATRPPAPATHTGSSIYLTSIRFPLYSTGMPLIRVAPGCLLGRDFLEASSAEGGFDIKTAVVI
jgi:hypothetical protein